MYLVSNIFLPSNFEVAPRYLDNLCIRVIYIFTRNTYSNIVTNDTFDIERKLTSLNYTSILKDSSNCLTDDDVIQSTETCSVVMKSTPLNKSAYPCW